MRPLIDSVAKRRRWLNVSLGAVGGVAVVVGIAWPFLPAPDPGTLRSSVDAMSRDFRWWFAILAALWIYQTAREVSREVRRSNEIVALRNDVQAIANVIDRAIMPRHLTRHQQMSFVSFLKQQSDPWPVTLRVKAGDQEADGFRADIQTALVKAGWSVTKIEHNNEVQEGLRITITRTMADSTLANNAKATDHAHHPERILQWALAAAGVRIDGSGGGSGVNVTETVLAIEIGQHRRDSYVVDPPMGLL